MTRDDDPFAEDAGDAVTSSPAPPVGAPMTVLGKRAEPASAVLGGTAPQRRELVGAAAVLSTDEDHIDHEAPPQAARPAAAPVQDLLSWD